MRRRIELARAAESYWKWKEHLSPPLDVENRFARLGTGSPWPEGLLEALPELS